MSLLQELFRSKEGDVETTHRSTKEEVVTINKSISALGGGGEPTGAFTAKCKGCHEIIMLTPKFFEFTCRCGTTYSLPKA